MTKADIADQTAARLAEVGALPEQDELKELLPLFVTALSDDIDAAL